MTSRNHTVNVTRTEHGTEVRRLFAENKCLQERKKEVTEEESKRKTVRGKAGSTLQKFIEQLG